MTPSHWQWGSLGGRDDVIMVISNSVVQPVSKVRNTAARFILKALRHENVYLFYSTSSGSHIPSESNTKTGCMFYNNHRFYPLLFSQLLYRYSPSRSVRSSSDTHMLKLQRFNRKTHGLRTWSHFGPHIRNNLPQDIMQALCY